MDNRIIEKTKQSLSFVEQLQDQIQKCREAISDPELYLTPKVDALESLLWAKLKDDEKYQERVREIESIPNMRIKAEKRFRAMMVFMDKKGYLSMGEEDGR